ncbi:MAG: hypothetical protein KIS96_01875 [Bauldia sp.]|nr:hypothetical protein [Bauldia sp.]
MRLTKLLLGSAAIMFASGAAYAADPGAPGVVVPTTSYVPQCGTNNSGWLKVGGALEWCLTFSGGASFSSSFGMDIDYDDVPTDAVSVPIGTGGWSGFNLSNSVRLVAFTMTPAGPMIISIPIDGSGVEFLTIGSFTFTDSYVSMWRAVGSFFVGFNVVEPGDTSNFFLRPVFGAPSIGGGLHTTFADDGAISYLQNDVPRLPDLEIVFGMGGTPAAGAPMVRGGFYVGQRELAATDFLIYGALIDTGFVVGPATVTFAARVDHTVIDPLGIASGLAPVIGNAFGVGGGVSFAVGDRASVYVNAAFGRNSGAYTGYHHDDQPAGNYLNVGGGFEVDITEQWAFGFDASFDRGPVANDGVIELGAGLTFNPFGNLEVTLGADWSRTQTGVSAASADFGVSVGF